jgi:hypothetical protein
MGSAFRLEQQQLDDTTLQLEDRETAYNGEGLSGSWDLLGICHMYVCRLLHIGLRMDIGNLSRGYLELEQNLQASDVGML